MDPYSDFFNDYVLPFRKSNGYIEIAPKSLPPTSTLPSSPTPPCIKNLPSKEHIVFTGKGQRNNPQFIKIIHSHKDKYLAVRRITGHYHKSSCINEVAESIYESWISGHVNNCFVRVDAKSKVFLQKKV